MTVSKNKILKLSIDVIIDKNSTLLLNWYMRCGLHLKSIFVWNPIPSIIVQSVGDI